MGFFTCPLHPHCNQVPSETIYNLHIVMCILDKYTPVIFTKEIHLFYPQNKQVSAWNSKERMEHPHVHIDGKYSFRISRKYTGNENTMATSTAVATPPPRIPWIINYSSYVYIWNVIQKYSIYLHTSVVVQKPSCSVHSIRNHYFCLFYFCLFLLYFHWHDMG